MKLPIQAKPIVREVRMVKFANPANIDYSFSKRLVIHSEVGYQYNPDGSMSLPAFEGKDTLLSFINDRINQACDPGACRKAMISCAPVAGTAAIGAAIGGPAAAAAAGSTALMGCLAAGGITDCQSC